MKERPILFSAPMVNAILNGTKTQTRRVVKKEPPAKYKKLGWSEQTNKMIPLSFCPYGQIGDRLWVRETWCDADIFYQSHTNDCPSVVGYRADKSAINFNAEKPYTVPKYDIEQWNWDKVKWKPSIFMPRWASRITLEITNIRVERLNDIGEDDAKSEGVFKSNYNDYFHSTIHPITGCYQCWVSAKQAFEKLWESINGAGSWKANPFVWVIEFKRVV